MAKLLKARNRELIEDVEMTYLTAAVAATGTTLTVKDNTNFLADNQYIMIGEPGENATEIIQTASAGTAGTSLTIDDEGSGGCDFAHPIGTPIYAIDYNQVEYSHASTASGSKTVLATSALTADHTYTLYEDTTKTSGFYFIRFKNSTTSTYSSYSAAIPYSGYTMKSLFMILKKVRRLIDELDETTKTEISDEEIIEEINDKQRDIAHDRLWPFYEGTKSLSSVEDQFKYTPASDVDELYFALFDTQPLAKIDKVRWSNLHWDSETTGDPTHVGIWDGYLWLYPRVSDDANTTTLDGAITSTTETTITVDDGSDFKRGDFYRFIIDSEVIYATGYDGDDLQFTGCLRGQEGTTAATHLDEATVTERNILYHYVEEPTDLSGMTDETAIPEPMLLAYGAAMELALKKEQQTLHDRLFAKYEKAYNRLRAKYGKKIRGLTFIKDVSEVVHDNGSIEDPNNYPTNINS